MQGTNHEEITRRDAFECIGLGKIVMCQVRDGEFIELSTMEDVTKAVKTYEAGNVYTCLRFYKKDN